VGLSATERQLGPPLCRTIGCDPAAQEFLLSGGELGVTRTPARCARESCCSCRQVVAGAGAPHTPAAAAYLLLRLHLLLLVILCAYFFS
jgi:hypothetical protein